jgi:phytase-like protein
VFNLYTREGDHHYVLTVDPRAGEIGDVEHTDGIAVTSCPTSSTFPLGLFVAHDGDNGALNQNFKLFGWEDIAGSRLIVDPHWSPRTPEVPRGLAQGSPESMAPGSSPVAVGVAGDSTCVHGGSNEPLLETESACLASPGSLTLGVGLERGAVLHGRTESTIPFALSFAAARRLELVVEPILYSHVQQRGQTLAAGVGDLEVNAIFAPLPEVPWRGSVAVSAEVKLPVARRSPLGSGKPDITGALVLSRPVAGADVHVNLGYTIIGHPSGIDTRNVYSFAVAAIRRLSQFDLVGEVFGHTPALADGREPEEIDGGANALPDLAGEELVCTLGGRLRLGDRAAIGVRVSYDEDRMFLVSPTLSLKLH